MRLSYDPDAVVDHYHPTDLHATLERMDRVGRAVVALTERVRTWPVPPRPGLRHRLRAAALAVANLVLPVRRVREAAWRFLCHEAYRESYWNVKPPDGRLLIGSRLLRIAERDEAVALPEPAGAPDALTAGAPR